MNKLITFLDSNGNHVAVNFGQIMYVEGNEDNSGLTRIVLTHDSIYVKGTFQDVINRIRYT